MNEQRQFASPWPHVLVEMKDFIQLALLAAGSWSSAIVEVRIAKEMLKQAPLQPHFAEFLGALSGNKNCQVRAKASPDSHHHQVQITTRN